jgi:peptidyl-prolyl cis-trans isomerase A (cyclophilin A)
MGQSHNTSSALDRPIKGAKAAVALAVHQAKERKDHVDSRVVMKNDAVPPLGQLPTAAVGDLHHHDDDHDDVSATAPFAVLDLGKHGQITFRLLPGAAPKTAANFQQLVDSGFYNGTALYRHEPNFCLQGGGWPTKRSPYPTVPLEYKLPNKQWFVSMARTSDPNSATAEFSIMLRDNSQWLGPGGSEKFGYAVFAEVVKGKDVIEQLGALPKKKQGGLNVFVDAVTIFGAYTYTAPAPPEPTA